MSGEDATVREVAESHAEIRLYARLSKDDMDCLKIQMGEVVEVSRADGSGSKAHARCFFMHREDEQRLGGRVQLDSIIRGDICAEIGEMARISRIPPPYAIAEKVTFKPLGYGQMPEGAFTVHPNWLAGRLEGIPLWVGSVIPIPYH